MYQKPVFFQKTGFSLSDEAIMFPTGHITYTFGGLVLLQARGWVPPDVDYRVAALVAVAPDLVDKPLSLLVFTEAQTTQGLCHTLVVHLAVTALVLLFARRFWSYAVVLNFHLVCDQIWRYPRTMLWPLLGPGFEPWKPIEGLEGFLAAYVEIAMMPEMLTLELIGLAMLAVLVVSRRLYRPAQLMALLRTGHLPGNGHPQSMPEGALCA
jgi:hypothetical protein